MFYTKHFKNVITFKYHVPIVPLDEIIAYYTN